MDKPPSQMTEAEFARAFAGVYEDSPWVAARLWQRGVGAAHDTAAGMARALAGVVAAASAKERDALLNAHPRLAAGGAMSASSQQEQRAAGVDNLARQEAADFAALNRAYEEKFNFPFVMAVAGADKAQIVAALRERLAGGDAAAEKRRAFAEIDKIAGFRLQALWKTLSA